jgi:hypothetical protein
MEVLEPWILMYIEFTCLDSSFVYLPLSQDHGNKYLYVNWEKVNSNFNVILYGIFSAALLEYIDIFIIHHRLPSWEHCFE